MSTLTNPTPAQMERLLCIVLALGGASTAREVVLSRVESLDLMGVLAENPGMTLGEATLQALQFRCARVSDVAGHPFRPATPDAARGSGRMGAGEEVPQAIGGLGDAPQEGAH